MAAHDETLRLAGDLRTVLEEHVDEASRDLVKARTLAWQDLTLGWADAVRPLMQADAAGEQATWAEIRRARRTQEALAATRRALDELARFAGIRILQPVDLIVEQSRAIRAASSGRNSRAAVSTCGSASRSRGWTSGRCRRSFERTNQRITKLATVLTPKA